MSVETVCEICAQRKAQNTCDQCGRVVCEHHYNAADGRCEKCAGPRTL